MTTLRIKKNFKLLRGKLDTKGLPCKLLQLNSGHWLEGDLAFELTPQFIPNLTPKDTNSDTEITEIYGSLGIRLVAKMSNNQNPCCAMILPDE